MEKNDAFTKMLALVGTLLVGIPIVAPFLFGALRFVRVREFLFDYLMPAELFPLVVVGGGLLIWSAVRARARWKILCWSFGIAAGMLICGQVLALLTGLATGRTEPNGFWWLLVLASIFLYSVLVVVLAINGILLLRGLLWSSSQTDT